MSYVFNKEVIGMTYKQSENLKTPLNDSLEKRIFRIKEPSSLNLHELQIGHTAVNMTEQYIKAHPNDSRLEAYKSILLSSSNQLNPMSASQFRHDHAYLYFSKSLKNKRK